MNDRLKIPAALQHLIEKREEERRQKQDRRAPVSRGRIPDSGDRRSGQERRRGDRRED